MNKHKSRQQSMNNYRRRFNQGNDSASQYFHMPYTYGVNCGHRGIESAARVWGILGIDEGIYSDGVDSSKVSNEVHIRFRKLLLNIKKGGFDGPEGISLLENGRVLYEALDSQISPYIRVILSKSGKTLQVTYRTHEYNREIGDYVFSESKPFPIDTSWEMIVAYIDSLGDAVYVGDTTFENYQPD